MDHETERALEAKSPTDKFGNSYPHAEDPITAESANHLEELATETLSKLQISENDNAYALSLSDDGVPVSISRYEDSDGMIILSIGIYDDSELTNILLREDTSLDAQGQHYAASRVTRDSRGEITDEDPSLSEEDITSYIHLVEDRTISDSFWPVSRTRHSLTEALAAPENIFERKAENTYVMNGIRPNLEDPISDDDFDETFMLAEIIKRQAGIEDGDANHLAVSEGNPGEPKVMVSNFSTSDKKRGVSITIESGGVKIGIRARTDVGTVRKPEQIGARIAIEKHDGEPEEDEALSSTIFNFYIAKAVSRADRTNFVKKPRTRIARGMSIFADA